MIDAALFLFAHSLKNWGKGMLRRLKSPRYALAILLGVVYVALLVLGQRQNPGGSLSPDVVSLGGSLLLVILVAKWWLFGADRLALAFSPAEIQFLFPAPISRSALLTYKLIRTQRLIVLNVLVWTLLLRRGGGLALGTGPYALTMWVFFSTVMLHRLGVALTRDAIAEHGWAGLRRAWGAMLALTVLLGSAWISLRRMPAETPWTMHPDGFEGFRRILETPPLTWVLWPFRLPLLPLEARTLGGWLVRLLPALALLGIHVWWVLRADRAFEEAAIDASARQAERLRRWRRQSGAAALPVRRARRLTALGADGHPIGAIVWKNLTRLIRTMSPTFVVSLLLLLVIGVAVGAMASSDSAVLTTIGTLALGWAAALAVLGPLWVRIDLRGDMDHLATLRTWPLSGLTLMTGQVLSSALVLILLESLLGTTGLLVMGLAGEVTPLSRPVLLALVAVSIPALAGLNLIALCIQNGAALLFPAWVRTEIRPGGIEQVGQQLLTAGVSFLLVLVAALGPALLAALAGYALAPSLGSWAFVAAGVVAALGLGLEVFLCLDWLGSRFERTDPSSL